MDFSNHPLQVPIGNRDNLFNPIGNRSKVNKPTGNRQLAIGKNEKIDLMLSDCSDLISPDFKKWFAGCFHKIDLDKVAQLASEARTDGHDKKKLFAHLIKKEINK